MPGGKAGQYVVVLLDVVDFKHINEKHGEQKGSEMLKYFTGLSFPA